MVGSPDGQRTNYNIMLDAGFVGTTCLQSDIVNAYFKKQR